MSLLAGAGMMEDDDETVDDDDEEEDDEGDDDDVCCDDSPLPFCMGMLAEYAKMLFWGSLSRSGSESVGSLSSIKGKMNFFLSVRAGETRREITGAERA